ncbi:MAG TPA: periplasmic heavy metal sensor [Thermoanaerobaculia bacterium]
MKRLALVVIVSMVACSSSDYDEGSRSRGGWGGDAPAMVRGGGGGMLDMMPPDDWWHDSRISAAVNVTPDQIAKLDQIAKDHSADDVTRLTRDSEVAMRDLRSTLESDTPSANDIVTAATRVRTLRSDAFDKQIQLLAAERSVLTKQQWKALQDAMQERPRDDRRGGYGTRGGFGGRGRGRGPGWPY